MEENVKVDDGNTTHKKSNIIRGRVISDRMNKTRIIKIETLVKHPLFKKLMRSTRKIKVHDENNESREGDLIEAVETNPLSKEKRHKMIKIVERVQ